ncbi:MAG TPA: hypothetical protein VK638_13995 [Edaphobacter sp.]|nr:hypothetical protein [Edaphobacter sp.]
MLDILISNGTLYQGISFQYFLDSDSKLAGIILKNPRRFLREQFATARSEAKDQEVNKEDFWRPIPSESLFIMGSSILNININYVPKLPLEEDVLRKFIKQALDSQQIKISIESPAQFEPPTEPNP